jgi:hypothetical protein
MIQLSRAFKVIDVNSIRRALIQSVIHAFMHALCMHARIIIAKISSLTYLWRCRSQTNNKITNPFIMSYRSKLFTSAASVVAPSPFGGLSEPLLAKKHDEDVGDVHADDNDEDDPWSSIGFIIGAVILSAAG